MTRCLFFDSDKFVFVNETESIAEVILKSMDFFEGTACKGKHANAHSLYCRLGMVC